MYYQRASLSVIAGPTWAPITRLWIVKTLASWRSHEIVVGVNERYGTLNSWSRNVRLFLFFEGSLARIGPNHLITSDPILTRRILSARSPYKRGPWFDLIRIDPHLTNIVSERDKQRHNRLRYKMSTSVSLETLGYTLASWLVFSSRPRTSRAWNRWLINSSLIGCAEWIRPRSPVQATSKYLTLAGEYSSWLSISSRKWVWVKSLDVWIVTALCATFWQLLNRITQLPSALQFFLGWIVSSITWQRSLFWDPQLSQSRRTDRGLGNS